MPPADGTDTWQYQKFRKNAQTFTANITKDLTRLAHELHSENLLTDRDLAEAINPDTKAYARAATVTRILLDRIGFNKMEFYRIGRIVGNIPGLRHCTAIFQDEQRAYVDLLLFFLFIWAHIYYTLSLDTKYLY